MGDVFSRESSCFRVGEVRRPSCHEYHDNRGHFEIPLSSSSFNRSSSEHSYKSKECRTDLSIYCKLARTGYCQENSKREQGSSLLFQTFLSSQRSWENSTYHRSLITEQAFGDTQVQDGNIGQDCADHIRSHVGHVGGHHRCLPSCPYRLGISCLLCLCARRRNIRLSGPSVRAILSSLDLLKSDQAYQEVPTFFRSAGFVFPGRLLDFGIDSPFDGCSHQINDRPSREVRLRNKLGEIIHCSTAKAGVSWGYSGPSESHSFSSSRKDRQDTVICEARSTAFSDVQEGPGETSGVLELHSVLSASGPPLFNPSHAVDEFSLVSGFERPSDSPGQRSEGCFDTLVGYDSFVHSSAYASSLSHIGDHDGRIRSRLEWLAFARRSVWFVESRRSTPLYELERVKGCPFDDPSFFGSPERTVGQGSDGQLNSGCLSPPPGLCWFSFTLGTYEKYFGLCRGEWYHSTTLSPQRCPECSGRYGFPFRPHFYRMVFRSSILLGYLRHGGICSRGRSFRHSFQFAIAYFCFSVPRPSCSWPGCTEFGLEPVGKHLSFSTDSTASRSFVEVEVFCGEGVPSCSQESVGASSCNSGEEILQGSSSPSRLLFVSEDQPGDLLHERPAAFYLEPCRLDAIINGYTKKGYGANSIRVLLEVHRESTLRQYQVAWNLFLSFLQLRGIVHHEVGLPDVFEFLAHYHELGRAYYTIAVYRCALKLPLRLELDLSLEGDDSDDFMRGLYNARPPPKPGSGAPMWALSDLLHYLNSEVFEPLAEKSLRVVTKKALALTLLATGRRIDDVSAFTRFYRTEGSSLRMSVPASHLSKNEKKGHVPEDATVLSLVSPHPSDQGLCPVRALNTYFLKRNAVVNKANDWRLWMHSKSILSYMVSSLIIEARVVADRSDDVRVGPHHLRKFAASYCKANWESSYKQVLYKRMGSKSMSVLARDYISNVDPLTVSCVVPMGTIVVPPP